MPRIALVLVVVVLAAHGLIHLMGTTVYMRLGEIQGLPYKTTLLGGQLDLGESGMRLFGALWVLPAVAFVVAAVGLVLGWEWWRSVLVPAAILSLALTSLDWSVAFMGVIVNVVILTLLWLTP